MSISWKEQISALLTRNQYPPREITSVVAEALDFMVREIDSRLPPPKGQTPKELLAEILRDRPSFGRIAQVGCTHPSTNAVDPSTHFGASLKCEICGHLAEHKLRWFHVEWPNWRVIND